MATKWSDYCISAVRFNLAHTHIDAVRVHQHLGDSLGTGVLWSRQQVITAIESRFTFTTVVAGSDGKWYRGADVNIVYVGSEKYLRTDRNQSRADNLDNLPELPAEPQAARY